MNTETIKFLAAGSANDIKGVILAVGPLNFLSVPTKLSARLICHFETLLMTQMRLFLVFLSLFLVLVPVHAQDFDSKYYYRLTSGSQNERSLTVLGSDDNQPVLTQTLQFPGQLWRIEDMGDGFVRLTNGLLKDKSLDINNDGVDNNKLVLNKTANVSGQHWWLTFFGEGFGDDSFRLTSRWQAGKSLEATTDLKVDRKLVVNKIGSISGQRWVLTKTDVAVEEKFAPTSTAFQLTSTAFVNGAKIPVKYTGEGEDISPPLAWKGAPAGTKSFLLTFEDIDAPSAANPSPDGPFVHWYVLNIPADTKNMLEGLPRLGQLSAPAGALQGVNGFDEIGYSGPLPPKGSGSHRYIFTLHAMDRVFGQYPNLTQLEIEQMIKASVLAQTQLMGTYEVP